LGFLIIFVGFLVVRFVVERQFNAAVVGEAYQVQSYDNDTSQYYETSGGSQPWKQNNNLQVYLTTESESSGDENSKHFQSLEISGLRSPEVQPEFIDTNFATRMSKIALNTDDNQRETELLLTNANSNRESLLEGEKTKIVDHPIKICQEGMGSPRLKPFNDDSSDELPKVQNLRVKHLNINSN